MSVTEEERFRVLNSLIEVHGEDVGRLLMDSIPPVQWHELATKGDLAALKEWAEAKFDAEFTSVRGELAKVEGNLSKEIGGLHKEIGGLSKEMAEQSKELARQSKEISDKLDSMRRWVVGSVVVVVGAVVGSGVWFG